MVFCWSSASRKLGHKTGIFMTAIQSQKTGSDLGNSCSIFGGVGPDKIMEPAAEKHKEVPSGNLT